MQIDQEEGGAEEKRKKKKDIKKARGQEEYSEASGTISSIKNPIAKWQLLPNDASNDIRARLLWQLRDALLAGALLAPQGVTDALADEVQNVCNTAEARRLPDALDELCDVLKCVKEALQLKQPLTVHTTCTICKLTTHPGAVGRGGGGGGKGSSQPQYCRTPGSAACLQRQTLQGTKLQSLEKGNEQGAGGEQPSQEEKEEKKVEGITLEVFEEGTDQEHDMQIDQEENMEGITLESFTVHTTCTICKLKMQPPVGRGGGGGGKRNPRSQPQYCTKSGSRACLQRQKMACTKAKGSAGGGAADPRPRPRPRPCPRPHLGPHPHSHPHPHPHPSPPPSPSPSPLPLPTPLPTPLPIPSSLPIPSPSPLGGLGGGGQGDGGQGQRATTEDALVCALGLHRGRSPATESPPLSLIFFGGAGAGKSFRWRHTLWRLERALEKEAVVRTALFGLVAQNVGGQTLHSWAGLTPKLPSKILDEKELQAVVAQLPHYAKRKAKLAKVLGIDDGSVLDGHLFTNLDNMLRIVREHDIFMGGLVVALTVDLAQLSPIAPQIPLWHSCTWRQLVDSGRTKLVHCQTEPRFSDTFWSALLQRLRTGTLLPLDNAILTGILSSPLPSELGPPVRIAPTHALYKEFERSRLESLGDAEFHSFPLPPRPLHDADAMKEVLHTVDAVQEWMTWKTGCRIMSNRNIRNTDGTLHLANGTMGEVHSFVDNPNPKPRWPLRLPVARWFPVGHSPFIETVPCVPSLEERGEEARTYELPAMLAEAFSIHKALGMTIYAGEVECCGMFAFAQHYEAFSRFPGFDHIRVLNFVMKEVMAPKASLTEMSRLASIAAAQKKRNDALDLDALLKDTENAFLISCSDARHCLSGPAGSNKEPPRDTACAVSFILEATKAGATYFDPGFKDGECAVRCSMQAFEHAQQPLTRFLRQHLLRELTGPATPADVRSCMQALAGTLPGCGEISITGKPVPLGAVALLLDKAGITASVVLVVESSVQYRVIGKGCPSLLLLYCKARAHLSLLTWKQKDNYAAGAFWASKTAHHCPTPLPLLEDRISSLLAANGRSDEDVADGDSCEERTVMLTSVRAKIIGCRNQGLPSGQTMIVFDDGLFVSMTAVRPTADDYNDHPTRIFPGYLWPCADERGKCKLVIGVEALPDSRRQYIVSQSQQGSLCIDLSATDKGATCWGPLRLPVAATGGRLEYGFYKGDKCDVTQLSFSDKYTLPTVRGSQKELQLTVGEITYKGSVKGWPGAPFAACGKGKLEVTGHAGQGEGSSSEEKSEGATLELDAFWIGGLQVAPAPLSRMSPSTTLSTRDSFLVQATQCERCFLVFSGRRPRHTCVKDRERTGGAAAQSRIWTRPAQRRQPHRAKPVDNCNDCGDGSWQEGDWQEDGIADEEIEGVGRPADLQTNTICVLDLEGSVYHAAVRTYLNSSFTSAGGSSAFCIVKYDVDTPARRRCSAAK